MNIQLKLFFIAFFLFFQNFAFAHNPQQASLKLSLYKTNGILEINLSQYGVEQALLIKYPDLNFDSIEQKEYKELLINYLKDNIAISVNGQHLKIGRGIIKLGSHQSDLKFQIENIPEKPEYVEVDAPCFQENEKQQNFFKVLYKEFYARANLTKNNDFKSKFLIAENEISVIEYVEASSDNGNNFIGMSLVTLGIILVFGLVKIKLR